MKARLFADENRKWWTLAAVSVGLFMIMLDNTIVNVALPTIEHSLHLQVSELEWIVTGYALTFGALLLTGGKLADLFGRRLVFVVGLVIFTASSLACGLAGSATILIAARVVQGIGAALMNPSTPTRTGGRRRGSSEPSRSPPSRSRHSCCWSCTSACRCSTSACSATAASRARTQ